jgi:hypothetical protein
VVRFSETAVESGVGRFVPAVAKHEWIFHHQEIARKKYEAMVANASL